MSSVTIKPETAELALLLLSSLELPTARAAAAARTNGVSSVEHFASVEAAIRDLKRGLYT